MKAHRFDTQGALRLEGVAMPQPAAGEVRIKVAAASLNYRDLLVRDAARQGGLPGRTPLSDAAGVVDALGEGVSRWRSGQRVMASFFRDWIAGRFQARYMASAWGGQSQDGVLAEYIVAPEAALAEVPEHLSLIEASALPCAGVTAWHALAARGGLSAGDTLLTQGTGGVALFGLQLAVALGARVIALSSSDDKLARARALGASEGINYRQTPDWDRAVRELTGGEGASHVLELGGPETFQRSLAALAPGGVLAQVGVLSGFGPKPDLGRLQSINADIVGVTVGSAAHLAELAAFMARHGLRPVIDRVFDFAQADAAYDYLRAASHFGKVAIRVGA
ncbi:NAD(P)-dependent alcohol dehydrogenase [Chromobacterium sp. IIBBL 290-4]|uniref:zinc-dependent alcohol dehydrogenase family protein n=1 Tax=Chromobacterium sp. IIBBL 290-4 TaxID=2953890 RepID=UPI0020B87F66|nr:NAD(P)-dependent alcohol dehydrogenase [Chromobacterium sp. IIBBL 290-4]UTH75802.1 NAD(P)-dependent alcohol dehydrogenase [Chromobacterium sp. IIBBL 290-4]